VSISVMPTCIKTLCKHHYTYYNSRICALFTNVYWW